MSGLASKAWVMDLIKKLYAKTNTYSTDETIVGRWIDGKPVYRKVVESTTPSTVNSETFIDTNISNIDQMISIDGIMQTAAGNFTPIGMFSTTKRIYIYYSSEKNKIDIRIIDSEKSSNWCNLPVYFILEYTKTTDKGAS